MLVEGIIFVAVTIAMIYIILYLVNKYKAPYQGPQPFYDLSVPAQLVLPTNAFKWSAQPCSIRFGIFVKEAPRTVSKVDCIEIAQGSTASSFAPSCSDYAYKPCQCLGTNCTACKIPTTAGYLNQLLSVGDYVQLWAAGYTSQNDKPYVPALLKIRTGTDASQHYMESVALPAIPLQRWTIITIVKEGRRFDVYYGAALQVSTLTDYVPIAPDSSQQWFAGNPQWRGQIGLFRGFTKAAYEKDVLADMEELVDTRGIPYYSEDHQWAMPTLAIAPPCILGNCNTTPNATPPNQFMVFQTNLA